ncbi:MULTISPECIES: hypothetical protein [unclassified Methylobacterium]|nr:MULTISPECIES: hypothetical protein [unclassified Methylobacterium]TXM88894.1 hypothetical protein FV223_23225 [Methylobacterium sp. WL116]
MRYPFEGSVGRARQVALFAVFYLTYFGLLLLLTRPPFKLSTNAAGAVTALSLWSTVVLIVGNRAWSGQLSLRDYANLYSAADLAFLSFGGNCLIALGSGLPDSAFFGLMLLSLLPCLALGTVTRRVLFSPEEWAGVAPGTGTIGHRHRAQTRCRPESAPRGHDP